MSNITATRIEKMIYVVRGFKVMLDSDLADLYNVSTKRLNEQVKRNPDRFPKDFVFQLSARERDSLKSELEAFQKSIARRKYLPFVFTEQGVAMLSSVLNSKESIRVNVSIMRVFVKLRQLLASDKSLVDRMSGLEKGADKMFRIVFERLDNVEKEVSEIKKTVPSMPPGRRRIGLGTKKKKK